MSTAHVLIVGAGLGGLGLAQGLKKHGIKFTVFERDADADARAQGYRIKIFPDTVPYLHYLTTPDFFREFEATSAETVMVESVICATNGQPTARRALRGPKPYTVDRGFLRKVLLRGLDDDVQWGKTVTSYAIDEANAASPVTVYFEDGSSASGSLAVGADGNHSRLRKQLIPHHKIIDPEGICLYGRTYLTPELEKRMNPGLNRGLNVIRDVAPIIQQVIFDSELPISMFVERMHFPNRGHPDHPELPEDYMYWSMLVPSKALGFIEAAVAAAFDAGTPVSLAKTLTEEWHDSVRCLVELQDESFASKLRIISSTPDLAEWEPSPFVTLLGDAIHVMSPSGGVGAATSLKDSVALTKALTEPGGITAEKIGAYEAAMRVTARAAIERSFRGGKLLYGQPPLEKCRVLSNS